MQASKDIVRRGSFYSMPNSDVEIDLMIIHNGIKTLPGHTRIRSTFEVSEDGKLLKWEVVDRPDQEEKTNA